MKFVDERLAVYDGDKLGYPSIASCHAIGYMTTRGLYGYHNLGAESADRWGPYATKFGVAVHNVIQPGETGLGMFGVAHVAGQRGYYAPKPDNWKAELVGFSNAVGWTGEIWGYDLTGFDRAGYDPSKSAYVEYRKVGVKCLIYVRQWRDHENIPGDPDLNFTAIALSKMPGKVTSALKTGGGMMHNVDPEQLR